MKMLHDLSRLFTPKPSDTQKAPQGTSMRRTSHSHCADAPTASEEEIGPRQANRTVSDAAQRLWCSAQHF